MNLETDYSGYTKAGASALSLSLDDFALWLRAHLETDDFGGLLSKETARRLYREEEGSGLPIFHHMNWPNGIGSDLYHCARSCRHEAKHRIFRNHGVGYFLASNSRGLLDLRETSELDDILVDRLFPGRWIRRPASTPEPDANGVIEGEWLDVAGIGGGRVH